MTHLSVLGSDSLQGRGTGTEGERKARHYISQELERIGAEPAGDNNTFFQNIQMHGSIPLTSSELRLFTGNSEHVFELDTDYLLYKYGAQTFVPNPVPLIFVGYGIVAPEYDYNDYQNIDVTDKIVVYLSGEPFSDDSTYFAGRAPTIYSYPESKQRMAIARGARGSILIPNPREEAGRDWSYWQNQFSFEDVTLAYSVTGSLSLVMNPMAAQLLFSDGMISLLKVFQMDANHTIHSFPLPGSVSFRGDFRERDFVTANVIGKITGTHTKLKDSYVILSAHYDHLGIGLTVQGDSIYNGVFDNAAGTAALLELAKVFNIPENRPERSLIFLFSTGEEKGILGSRFYLDHPIVPHYKTVANINVDGLAMFDTFKDIVGVGAELSSLGDYLETVTAAMGLYLSPIPAEFLSTETFARSDQIAFALAGIPAIAVMDGLNYEHLSRQEGLKRWIEWQEKTYHSPFDDLQQPMNLDAAMQHIRLLHEFVRYTADSPTVPEWKPGSPYINARLQSFAEKR